MDLSLRDVPAVAGSNKTFADALAADLSNAVSANPDRIEVCKLEPASGWGGMSPATQQLGQLKAHVLVQVRSWVRFSMRIKSLV